MGTMDTSSSDESTGTCSYDGDVSVAIPDIIVESNVTEIFTELLELKKYEDGYQEWVEISRWIKYQETVEPEGNRWSKPHVSTPTLQGWLELRKSLQDGLILVDIEAPDFASLCHMIGDELV